MSRGFLKFFLKLVVIIKVIIIFAIIIKVIIMMKLNNPFVIGTYAGEHYFCDRVVDSKELINNIPVELTSTEFINKYRLQSASSVQSALKGLISKKIVTKENGSYVIADRLFRMWLIQ